VSLTSISRSAGGKIKEVWQTYDTFGVMQQLGVAPKPKGK
jgi:predicted ester cyclase